ncbi:unnamed protein product [Closterium sp. NIES-54]
MSSSRSEGGRPATPRPTTRLPPAAPQQAGSGVAAGSGSCGVLPPANGVLPPGSAVRKRVRFQCDLDPPAPSPPPHSTQPPHTPSQPPLRPLPTPPSHAAPPPGAPRPAKLSLASLLPLTDCHVAADSAEQRPGKKVRSAVRCASWQSGDVEGRVEEGDLACEEQEMRDEECGKEGEEEMVEAEGRKDEEGRDGEERVKGEEKKAERMEGEKAEEGAEEGVPGGQSHSSFEVAAASLLVLKQGGQHTAPAAAAAAAAMAPATPPAASPPAGPSGLALSLSPSPPARPLSISHSSTLHASAASGASGWCDPLALSLTLSLPLAPHSPRQSHSPQQGQLGLAGTAVAHDRHSEAQQVAEQPGAGAGRGAGEWGTAGTVREREELPATPRQGAEATRGMAVGGCDEDLAPRCSDGLAPPPAAAAASPACEALQPSCHAAGITAAVVAQSRRIKLRVEGSPVGRTVDLSGIGSFQSLYATCAAMLQLPLQQPAAGAACPWQLTYTDADGDTLLVGDGPWSEFVRDTRKLSVIRTPKLQQWGYS